MSYEAARILHAAKRVSKQSNNIGIDLGTVISAEPFKISIDNIGFPVTRESLMICSNTVLNTGDRIAVARTNMNCWVVLCKVVSA